MSVRLAAQLFSRSTAIGLKMYRKEGVEGLEDSAGTEAFTRIFNVFDALNAKHPAEGIHKGSPKILVGSCPNFSNRIKCRFFFTVVQLCDFNFVMHIIQGFLELLNSTEKNHRERNMLLFASRQTTESLRVTLMTVLDIIDGLHKAGIPYNLTVKLNQDPLERFFGVVRSFRQSIIRQSSDNDHPTIVQFSQIYRILSLFTPVKNTVKRNCSGQADTVLVSLHKSLGEKAKAAAEIKRAVEAKLHKKLFGIAASEGK
ncbi:uncharacterized protein LOC142813856 [Rhipicephalus microplus]|uniref:uncharacterized protein LOC142813856 n=1 Tax=Rhipicephalus microplus TaxID=6941 RepID=UPI003F6B2EF6